MFLACSTAMLTFDTAAAGLQHPGVHIHPRLWHQLVTHQVGVVRGSDEIVAQRLVHVLVHVVVFWVENVPRWAAHIIRKTWKRVKQMSRSLQECYSFNQTSIKDWNLGFTSASHSLMNEYIYECTHIHTAAVLIFSHTWLVRWALFSQSDMSRLRWDGK